MKKWWGTVKKIFPALRAGNCAPPLSNCFRRHWSKLLISAYPTDGRQSALRRQALMTFSKTSWLLYWSLKTLKWSVITDDASCSARSIDWTIFFTLSASLVTQLNARHKRFSSRIKGKGKSVHGDVTKLNWSELIRFIFWRTDQWPNSRANPLVIGWRC